MNENEYKSMMNEVDRSSSVVVMSEDDDMSWSRSRSSSMCKAE